MAASSPFSHQPAVRRPVEQFKVTAQRHRQITFVAAACRRLRLPRPDRIVLFIDWQWGQKVRHRQTLHCRSLVLAVCNHGFDATLSRGVVAGLDRLCDRGSNRVEVNVQGTGQNRSLIDQQRRPVAILEKNGRSRYLLCCSA